MFGNPQFSLLKTTNITLFFWIISLAIRGCFLSQPNLKLNKFSLPSNLLLRPISKVKFKIFTQIMGGEYLALRQFLSTHGISHLTTPPHTPEHNGLSERKHRHIVETGLSLLSSANMPLTYWPSAFATAVFLINRLPTPVLSNQSLYQKLFKMPPNYLKLRTFGCLCFPWLRPYAPDKFQNRYSPCIFIGYSLTQSAYQCL